jgi:hypothetical protein
MKSLQPYIDAGVKFSLNYYPNIRPEKKWYASLGLNHMEGGMTPDEAINEAIKVYDARKERAKND